MGPHSSLSLRGGTGCPVPHWNLELAANVIIATDVGLGRLLGGLLWLAVKSFGEPHSIESSLVDGGSCALCYSRHDFQYPV